MHIKVGIVTGWSLDLGAEKCGKATSLASMRADKAVLEAVARSWSNWDTDLKHR